MYSSFGYLLSSGNNEPYLRSGSNGEKVSMVQVWLITGSSRGLGRALAETVLAAGHRLVATARNPAQLSDLAERRHSHD